jgi:putative phosphoribosyl transferase
MTIPERFADRRAAGRALAQALAKKDLAAPVVLALPRGGVAVAAEIARALKAPLDIVLVRKIGVPFQPELAAAAVVDGGEPEIVTNEDVVKLAGVTSDYIEAEVKRELEEIERRRKVYLQGRTRVPLAGRSIILVDDGIATGASIRAALRALKRKEPKALILAVPVAPPESVEALKKEVDEVVCLMAPEPFFAIGIHYLDFHQMSDAEVVQLLAEQSGEREGRAAAEAPDEATRAEIPRSAHGAASEPSSRSS